MTDDRLEALRARALANPLYRNLLLSEDGRTTVLTVELDAYSGTAEAGDLLGGFGDEGDADIDAVDAGPSELTREDEAVARAAAPRAGPALPAGPEAGRGGGRGPSRRPATAAPPTRRAREPRPARAPAAPAAAGGGQGLAEAASAASAPNSRVARGREASESQYQESAMSRNAGYSNSA